jgi:hypothetical protein
VIDDKRLRDLREEESSEDSAMDNEGGVGNSIASSKELLKKTHSLIYIYINNKLLLFMKC